MSIKITQIGGNCPVQAEGMIDGQPFYFRARGSHWGIGIGPDPVAKAMGLASDGWGYVEEYPGGSYDAGWMTEDEARAFIEKAAKLYAERDV